MKIRRLIAILPLPATFQDIEGPSTVDIRASQISAVANRPQNLVQRDHVWRHPESDAIWIPDGGTGLQLRFMVIAHSASTGHRGCLATEQALSSNSFGVSLPADTRLFGQSCTHCLSMTGGDRIPCPFGTSAHGTQRNDLAQFGYVDLGASSSDHNYVLLVRDDHSEYCCFHPSPSTTAEFAANALVDWRAAFGAPNGLMSYGPTHL